MNDNQRVPYMRLTSDPRPAAPRARRGMTIEQVREIWLVRSQAIETKIMAAYKKQWQGGAGREGLGIYGRYASRVASETARLAERLLASAGLPTDEATIRKLRRR